MIKKKHDLLIYHPFPAIWNAEVISEAGAAILGHGLENYVEKGRALILRSRPTDCCGVPILA